MKGKILNKTILNRELAVYLPDHYDTSDKIYPVIYVQDGDTFQKLFSKIMVDIEANTILKEHVIVAITPENRLDEYTPWSARANSDRFPDFGGKGDNYLEFLGHDFSSFIAEEFRVNNAKEDKKIMGHSLGALICLYSIFRNDDYGKIASLCASQWYDKWLSFIETEPIINKDINLFLLAGRREGEGKSTIQKDTTKCTQLSCEIFQKRLGNDRVEMLWDDYGHHDNMISRYTTALEFLMKD